MEKLYFTYFTVSSGFPSTSPPPNKYTRLKSVDFFWQPDLLHTDQNGSVLAVGVASDSIRLPCPQDTWEKQP